MIAGGVHELEPDAETEIVDSLAAMGKLATAIAGDGSEVMFNRLDWLFDALYLLFSRWRPTRELTAWLADLIGHKGLGRVIERFQPDVIVSTYPGATDVLGRMRLRGELSVPVVSAISDLAALRFWAHPGVDLHLVIHPESDEEIQAIAPGTRVVAVRGMSDPRFEEPADRAAAREALDLPADGPLIVVSGGGWAVGDLGGAAEEALAAAPDATVLVLCGRSDQARAAMQARFGANPRVRIWGFTEEIPQLFAAADVLVHSTAGLTVFEAIVRGCRVISYGWGVAHIRLNNEAYTRFGLATVADGRPALAAALRDALASPAEPDAGYAVRPSAAGESLALVRRRPAG